MSILLLSAESMFFITEGTGGLFDFNATLPLMAIQFMLLNVGLTFVFYKPLLEVIERRETFIRSNLALTCFYQKKSDWLYRQSEERLKVARVAAQSLIAQSEKEANDIVAEDVKTCLVRTQVVLDREEARLADRIYTALDNIEFLGDGFSRLIEVKLVGGYLYNEKKPIETP